jgi:hypothetical protein
MKLEVPIKEIKRCENIDEIKKVVLNLSDEWDIWEFRQRNYTVHKNTKSYPFFWGTDENILLNNNLIITEHNKNCEILNLIQNDLQYLMKHYDGKILKIMLSNLLKNKTISEHIDAEYLLINSHRLHLPIITNADIIFRIEEYSYNMEYGIWYEFDNTRFHGVINGSDIDRVHLMVDIIPNKLIENKNINIIYE